MNKSILVVLTVGAALSARALQHWNTQGHVDTLLSKAENYNEKKDPNYGVQGGDSNLGGFPTGTYTLDADMTANRIVFDAKNGANAEFNLQGHTLTLLGVEQAAGAWAFGVPTAGSKATVRLTSGTIRVPWQPEAGKAYTNCYFKVGRESTATNFTFVVDGSAAKLDADKVDFAGNYNTLRVENGGLAIADDVAFANTSNRLVVTGAGSSLTVNNTLSPGNGGTGNTVTIADGATATVKTLNVSGGTKGNGVIVTGGGELTVSTSVNLGSTNSDGNFIRVEGEGSVLKRTAAGNLIVGSSIWAKNARLEVLDGGSVSNFYFSIGSGNDKGQTNGGHLLAFRGNKTDVTLEPPSGKMQIGDKGSHDCRFEVTDGATVRLNNSTSTANNRCWVSNNSNAYNNVVLVDGAGSKLDSNTTDNWLIGQHGRDSSLIVSNGGAFISGGGITAGQGDSVTARANGNLIRAANGALIVAKGLSIGYGGINDHGGENLGQQAHSNRLEIVGGSVVTNTSTLTLGHDVSSDGNFMLVSNATYVGNGDCYIGRLGGGNGLRIEDGGVFTNRSNIVRCGYNSELTKAGNRVEILSGGILQSTGLFELYGDHPQLVVSNGTLSAGANVGIGPLNVNCTNAEVFVAGSTSAVRAGTYMNFYKQAKLHIAIPEEGHPEPIFAAKSTINMESLSKVTWDIAPELVERKETVTIARAGTKLNMSEASLKALREGLPADCKISVKGKDLVLKAGLNGLMMLIR